MDFLEKMNWRYATKAMNGQKVSQEKINNILEAIRLAPTSSGLQPFEIMVISNDELKEKIKQVAFGQPQITSCSHLLVFAAWETYTEERINRVFDLTNTVRGGNNEGWEAYRKQLLAKYPPRDAAENFQHTARQTYIALMAGIAQAAFEGVDSTPMEGFENEKLDALLNLNEKGLKSTVLLPLGYRDAPNDWLVNLPKVRRPQKELFTIID
ncbi:MAG: NAD(P)H-dependent oxidoreductase [Bacteroidetes bacterium]|nr:MAG: NAD(P)H-dependent oxidoreductase [Bacteroidota bacterium]